MTATLGWGRGFGSRSSTQLTAVTSCGVILYWRVVVIDELRPFGYKQIMMGHFFNQRHHVWQNGAKK